MANDTGLVVMGNGSALFACGDFTALLHWTSSACWFALDESSTYFAVSVIRVLAKKGAALSTGRVDRPSVPLPTVGSHGRLSMLDRRHSPERLSEAKE